jgi:hypothetical protein
MGAVFEVGAGFGTDAKLGPWTFGGLGMSTFVVPGLTAGWVMGKVKLVVGACVMGAI